ncbi:TRAP transporter small permease [Histidinibacterium aquaticum]|uniref:TRAP transporter small permease protein n=2 Tax=Histidinibacterium aquaticum TaxID=2613962 RepID=A0A5J5GMZ3_9RHOB|nr:TRAP transporter small permease [Histidinibacterium aquaticum]
MTAFIAWQVWGRFVLNDTPTWTETSSVLLMGFFILLGAAVGIREGNHLSFDVLLYLLGPKAKSVLHSVSDLVVIAFACGMIYYGTVLAANAWDTTIPNLGISGAVSFFALVTGGVLMTLFSVERLLRRVVGLHTARFGEQGMDGD